MEQRRWQDWVMLALGIWLFFSPFFLAYSSLSGPAAWNSYIVGVAVVVLAGAALARWRPWEEWVNLVLGVWLILAPFLLAYSADRAATWNHIIVGLLIGAGAAWNLVKSPERRAV